MTGSSQRMALKGVGDVPGEARWNDERVLEAWRQMREVMREVGTRCLLELRPKSITQ